MEKKRVLLIGPRDIISGHGTYVNDFLHHNFKNYKTVLFNTTRKKRLMKRKHKSEAFSIVNTNPLVILRVALVTLIHIMKFIVCICIKTPNVLLITGTGNLFLEQMWFILLAKIFRIKVILHYHGPFYLFWEESSIFKRKCIGFFYGLLDTMIVLSQRDCKCARIFLREGKFTIIPNYVTMRDYQLASEKKMSVEDNIVKIIFIGGINPLRKGLEDLISVMNEIIPVEKDVRFILSGGGEVRKCLTADIHSNCWQRVDYVGWLSERQKRKMYKNSDIMVLPSYDEGMPYVLIEAMASGMAIVSTDVGGIPELIPSEKYGIIIQPGDTTALKDSLLLLIRNSALRESMGGKNIKRIKKYYTQDIIFDRIESVLCKVLNIQYKNNF